MIDSFVNIGLAIIVLIIGGILELTRRIIDNQAKAQREQYNTNLMMAEATASATNPLKYEDIVKIVEGVIANICIMDTIMNGYATYPKDSLSLVLDDIVADISVRTEQSLSKELLRQWEKFVTPEYRTEWVVFKVRSSILYQINNEAARLTKESQSPRVSGLNNPTVQRKLVNWTENSAKKDKINQKPN